MVGCWMCGFVKPCGYMTTSGFTTTSKLLYDLQWACCTCSIDLVQFLYIVVHSLQRPTAPWFYTRGRCGTCAEQSMMLLAHFFFHLPPLAWWPPFGGAMSTCLSLGWLEFGLTWVWAGLSLGWLEFGLTWVWAGLSLGWLEFGLTWVWAGKFPPLPPNVVNLICFEKVGTLLHLCKLPTLGNMSAPPCAFDLFLLHIYIILQQRFCFQAVFCILYARTALSSS